MSEWPPATVMTPIGEEPFDQAIGWYVPLMVRWISHNPGAVRVPSGEFVSCVLETAARIMENLAAEWTPQPPPSAQTGKTTPR